jgi:uncharacterized protein YjdB
MAVAEHCTACGTSLRMDDLFCPRCGTGKDGTSQPAVPGTANEWQALFPRLVRAVAPRYNVVRFLGQGGMAAVYLAEEPRLARSVAIKVLSPGLTTDPAMVGRFAQEARTTAQLRHPNIVAVHDFGEGEGLHFFVLEYVAGRTLAQLMKDVTGQLPFAGVTHLLAQAAAALVHAHRAGIVHRDIKPANIMIDGEGNAMLTDFGIAKVAEDNGYTRTGMLIGTPSYMSPEQCTPGSPVTGASDQYSLGIVAYELLTGAPPFTGAEAGVVHAHLDSAPEPVLQRRPDCPPRLAAMVERMLLKDPALRYPTMLALLSETGISPLPLDDALRVEVGRLATRPLLNVSPSALHFDALGERAQLQAQLTDWIGNVLAGAPVHWTCSTGGIVEVEQDGVVLATGMGTAEIIAESRGARTVIPAEVRQRAAAIHIAPHEQYFDRIGQRAQLKASVVDRNGNVMPQPVDWISQRPDVVRVDSSGAVEAVANGTATLIASAGGVQAAVRISVLDCPARIMIDASDVLMTALGEEYQLRADVLDSSSQPRSDWAVSWTSSRAAVVAVDASGRLTARGNGRAEVTASVEQVTATVQVTVRQVASALELTPVRVTLDAVGDSLRFSAVATDCNGTPLAAPVLWGSSDPAIATVDAAGRAEARAEGEAVITARSGELTATASVLVHPEPAALVVQPAAITFDAIGLSQALAVSVCDSRGNIISRPWTCYSDETEVVGATQEGVVTSVGEGRAHVHVVCGGLDSIVAVEVQRAAMALIISPPRIHARALGVRTQLHLEANDAAGSPVPVTAVAWSSSNPRVVSVDETGVATSVGPGHARIRAWIATTAQAEIEVTVAQDVASLRVTPPHVLLTFVGARAAIQVAAEDPNGAAVTVPAEFRASDTTVFTVDEHGRILAIGTGHAECEVQVGERLERVTVSVAQEVVAVVCRPKRLRFRALSERKHVTASCFDVAGHPVEARVHWLTSDPAVVLVDTAGMVAAVGDGSAVVTAQVGDSTGTVVVNVERRPGSVRIYQDLVELEGVGETEELRAVVLDGGGAAFEVPISWSSSDPRVATVDAAGLVTAAGEGDAQVTARAGSVAASVRVRVAADAMTALPFDVPPDAAEFHSAMNPSSVSDPPVISRLAAVLGSIAAVMAIGVVIIAIVLPGWRKPIERGTAAVQTDATTPQGITTPQADSVASTEQDRVDSAAATPDLPMRSSQAAPRVPSPEPPARAAAQPSNMPPDPLLNPDQANRAVAHFLTVLMDGVRDGRVPAAALLSGTAANDVQHLLNARATSDLSWEFISRPAFRSRDRAETIISVELGPDSQGLLRPPERLRAVVVRTPTGFLLESIRPGS